MHESFVNAKEVGRDIQRVIQNLFLIKILKTSDYELDLYKKSITSLQISQFHFNKCYNLKNYRSCPQPLMKLGVMHVLDTYMLPYQGLPGKIKRKNSAFVAFVAFI